MDNSAGVAVEWAAAVVCYGLLLLEVFGGRYPNHTLE